MSFANPAALWALLGLPAVLLIHFLQVKARPREISTLFLLDMLPEESRRGAVLTRLRNSAQLWCHLLAVLLLALILSQPRWTRPESVQSIVVVLDDTANMAAFREETLTRTRSEMRRLSTAAARSEWRVMTSDPGAPQLYSGDELSAALAALDAHRPLLGLHDPAPALARARELAGPDGLVLWVTAHPVEAPPAGAESLGIGKPADNAGFTGLRIEPNARGGHDWVASLLQRGETEITRQVQVQVDDQPPRAPAPVTLPPGTVVTLRGELPAGSRRGVLRLDPDLLDIDDAIPFVVPRPKILTYSLDGLSETQREWPERVMGIAPHVRRAQPDQTPGLVWQAFSGDEPDADHSGIFFYAGETRGDPGTVISEDHPLVRDLSWSPFLGFPHPGFAQRPGDRVLVWSGDTPLVVLREGAGRRQLILLFRPERGNAERLPAVVLTLHRFLERAREAQLQYEARPYDARERISLAVPPGEGDFLIRHRPLQGEPREFTHRPGAPLYAPETPGFLEILRGDETLLDAAIQFTDTAATDLTRADSRPLPGRVVIDQLERHSHAELLTPLWFALLLLALLGGWVWK
ncbi:MAG: BatA domain-containing protein [Verrucomicrobia bacterium]|nr:BatA domain-containing protein [Verrucomicrobiota bacterium]MCH8513365.1 BatA domain-containing protein [Kiritimatiellia bacterium]